MYTAKIAKKIEPVNLFGDLLNLWGVLLVFDDIFFQSCLHFISICRQLKFNALALVDVLSVPLLNQVYVFLLSSKI